ncbi:MAG: hypothetical protein ACJ8GN_04020 [Longimicrobiaceae bacterium]
MNRRKALLATAVLFALSACTTPSPGPVVGAPQADPQDSVRHEIGPEPIPITGQLRFDPAQLPDGTRGKFASFDGDNFAVNLPPRVAPPLTAHEVLDRTVVPLLRAMGYGERLGEITLPRDRPQGDRLPTPDLAGLAAETCKEVEGNPYQRFHAVCRAMIEGTSNPVAERVFQLAYGLSFAQFKADLERPQIVYVFTQRLDSIPIEHVGIVAARWEGETVTTVHGSLLNRYRVTNQVRLSPQTAADSGQARLLRLHGIDPRLELPRGPADLVLLPYGAARAEDGGPAIGLRYAYRTLLSAFPAGGPQRPEDLLSWRAWIDAETGRLLELTPQFASVSGAGLSWRRDPGTPTQLRQFTVDQAGGSYVLSRAGVFKRVDRFGDGAFDDGEVSIPASSGVGSTALANFNVPPLNAAANALCASGANDAFRQVNAFANLTSYREILVNAGTIPLFPEAPATIRMDMGGNQNSASYDGAGTGQSVLSFAIGSGFSSPACPDVGWGFFGMASDPSVLSATNDATGMTHEFAHISTARLQDRRPANWCGTLPCPIPGQGRKLFHDFADAFAEAYASSPCMGGWYRKNAGGVNVARNCATHHEGGALPRLASVGEPFSASWPLDHFPEKRATFAGDYADGQIVAAALWLTRQGMRSKSLPSGTVQYWVRLVRGVYNFGVLNNTCTGCDRDIYRYAQNLLQQLAQQWATAGQPGGPPGSAHDGARTANKLLSGWARVGIFLVPSPCIDGNAATGDPTFCPVSAGGEMGGDAVVDVFDNAPGDDNVIDQVTHPEFDYIRRGGPLPTFRVWTGPRFKFNASGMASSYTPSAATPSPCYRQYQVELSSSPNFTPSVKSLWISVSTTTQPECYGTWTPTASTWNALGGTTGDVEVYYRVRTRNTVGGPEKISTAPGSGSYIVPAPYVIVNATGQP